MVRLVGQAARLQETESCYGAPDQANSRGPRNPDVCPGRLLFITVQVAACLLANCARRPADPSVSPSPDVLLVTIDTLRADRVGVYGGLPATTPNLDRLARGGVTFMDATAHAPLTAPSHASILTGQYPPHHELRDNGGFVLSSRSRTLAEMLRAHGYHTGAFVASYVLNRGTGLNRGFQTYADSFDTSAPHLSLPSLQRRGPEIARDAVRWLAGAPRPFFLWMHVYDPHAPYDPPPAFGSRFPGKPYEAEIATSDWAVGEVLRAVEQKSRNALVIVTADHGESLGEHGEMEHGIFLYDATLRVPLIMSGPMIRAGQRVQQQVRHVDILPTIADWVGAQVPPGLDGTSLKPLVEGHADVVTQPSYSESLFGQLHFGWSDLHAVRDGQWKFVQAPAAELYDVRADPGERSNLFDRRRDTAAKLSRIIRDANEASAKGPVASGTAADSVTAQRLKSLGYVSGRIELGAAAGADPKTQIAGYVDYVQQFTRGVDALQAGRQREAERVFERLVRMFPESYEVHQYLGRTRAADGRHDDALREFERARRLSPGSALVAFDEAKSLAAKRDFAAALTRVTEGLTLEPDTFYGYVTKGQVLRAAGQRAEAQAAFEKALTLSPGLAIAEYELGALAEVAGDPAAAASHYQRALTSDAGMVEARAALSRVERQPAARSGR
jgi:choline-sulfatase